MNKICIIGLGKLGSHLARSLNRSSKNRVVYTVKNSNSKIDPKRINECNVIFISTSDSEISRIARELKKKRFSVSGKYVYHTSGAFDSGLLEPLRSRGAETGSFHPVQTFESKAGSLSRRLTKIYVAAEGTNRAVNKAQEISHSLKSRTIILTKDNKILHHISSVIASNYLVSFFRQVEKLSQLISTSYNRQKGKLNGFKKSSFLGIYKPLIEQTLKNIESKGTAGSLTGPIARNDLKTIKAHIRAIRNRIPELLPFYSLMGTESIKLALMNKSVNKREAEMLLKVLNRSQFTKRKRKK